MESGAEGTLVQGLSGAFLVGLAGFLYLHASYYRRFQHAAASPQTRTSLSFAYGIGFLLLTGVCLAALRHWSPRATHNLHAIWRGLSPVAGLDAVFVVAPGLGGFCPSTSYRGLARADEAFGACRICQGIGRPLVCDALAGDQPGKIDPGHPGEPKGLYRVAADVRGSISRKSMAENCSDRKRIQG